MQDIKNSLDDGREWNFRENGHWIIIDDITELESPLKGTNFELNSLDDGLFENIEAVELKNGVYELIFLLGNEFGVGVLVRQGDVKEDYKNYLESYLAA